MGATAAGVLAGCASILGITDGIPRDGDAGVADGGDAMTYVDVGPPPPDVNLDATIAICDDAGISLTALYVTPQGSDNGTCSKMAPCRTVSHALSVVQSGGTIYLAKGDYKESLSISQQVTLQGGFEVVSGEWSLMCNENVSRIVADVPAESTLDLNGGAKVTLRLLTVLSPPAHPQGWSRYAIRVLGGAALDLDNAKAIASAAAPGQPGGAGFTEGNFGCVSGTGSAGVIGPPNAGTFDDQGFVPGNGNDGLVGSFGPNGTGSTAGQCGMCTDCNVAIVGDASSCQFNSQPKCAMDGSAGCGGDRGTGGNGGFGGGASVAVFVATNGELRVRRAAFGAANGGNGGVGGPGGEGGAGGMGQPGMPILCRQQTDYSCVQPFACFSDSGATLQGGNAGTSGGPGGAGGPGAGGAGGWSVAVVARSQATTAGLDAAVYGWGNAGTPGAGGATGKQGPIEIIQ